MSDDLCIDCKTDMARFCHMCASKGLFEAKALNKELVSIVDDLDYVLTNVWNPDYKKFHDQFSKRCKEVMRRARESANA